MRISSGKVNTHNNIKNTLSQEDMQAIRIERAMQWVLDDLFNNRPPSPDDWALIPPGNATEAFEALNKAFPDGSRAVGKVFQSLVKIESHRWLIPLRNKAIPPRDATGEPINLVGTLLSEVKPKDISWLWQGRLPLGKLVMLDGDPGLGKTTAMFDVAARLSKGTSMPYEFRTSCKRWRCPDLFRGRVRGHHSTPFSKSRSRSNKNRFYWLHSRRHTRRCGI